tara:strand:- start:247 stop:909 length:663 start_codon:yes stop_codon:yes gene_type:complete
MRNFLILVMLFMPLPLLAEPTAFDNTLTSVYILIRTIGVLMGAILAFMGIKKLVDYAQDQRNPKNSPISAIVIFFAAGLLLNLNQTMSMVINTVQGNVGDSYCFYAETTRDNPFGNNTSCFNDAMQLTEELAQKLKNENGAEESVQKLKEKLRLLFTLFQVIGVIYFIKAIYMLKEASEGSQQTGYGKIILMIFASALVIDMPHTIDMLINTIQSWNETV